jgi:hypothetical protein
MSHSPAPLDVARSYLRLHGGRSRTLHTIARLRSYLDLSGLGERCPYFHVELDLALAGIEEMGGPAIATWNARKEAQFRALVAESAAVALRDTRNQHEKIRNDPTRAVTAAWELEVAEALEMMGERLPTGWDFGD